GLDLLEADRFTAAKITAFAADPVAALLARTGNLVVAAGANLAQAIDPNGAVVAAVNTVAGVLRLDFGATAAASVILDATGATPAIELCGALAIDDVGTITVERLRLTTDGAELRVRFDAVPIAVGAGIELVPVATARVGITASGVDRLIGIGLATDGVGAESVQFRWGLDGAAPRVVVVTRTTPDPADPKLFSESENADLEAVATALVSVAGSMAIGLALDALDPVGQTVADVLDGVIFTAGTTTIDPQLFRDLGDPSALLDRLYLLGFNLAAENIKLTIDSAVEIGFTGDGTRAGVFVSLAPGQRIDLGSSDPTVAIEIVADWINSTVAPGLSILLVERGGTLANPTFSLEPSVAIAGLGLRIAKTSGPLLDVGVLSVDAIGVHVYGEAAPAGVGAGLHVQLDGVAFTPTAGGGDNAVANNLMSDAADSATPAARPSFSPALAIQAPPGGDLGITFRAGDPPGPWWVVVQRQLGPLYLSQFGIDVTEADGTITGLSLLFDARVSIFGLSAEVDRLGLHWLGGDFFDLEQWKVDLQGLAVSADFSGVSISGGLLRTDLDGQIGYVGMLMGRFGVYGLSLFGGYTDDNGSPSFFVFGAVNGPIGGPPAFFLTGIGGGLGINRGLRVPDDLSRFDEYPFIKALDPAATASESPLQELRELAEYFPPQAGNFWFAAGISFNSFALVDGIAVVSVSFGAGLEINLFGLARLALPRPQVALVSLEIGLLARFSTVEGLFLIQAQLTDNSWLLYPEVRLTGG
ncbi:DUF6603 domain-containing protein, partial [Ilumatobacter nonamiensis]|uniref:DUF6603 domain-containing protein n=1 Tax=Ilumatobacter nonamiensis TaxID=467093 RepID=UPI000590ECA5